MSPVMTPMPMERFLVPETSLQVAPGFARSRQALTRGVPFEWVLDGELSLVLFVPTGLASVWRDADPSIVVSASGDETAPHQAPRGADAKEKPPLRLLLRQARATVATIPLATGLSRLAPDGNSARTVLDLFVVGWLLTAGSVRGAGDWGSFVEVAWRRADRGQNDYPLPPVDPHVAARNLALAQSTIGIPGATSKPRGGYLP